MGRVIDKRLFGLINDYFTLYLPNYKSASEHTLRSYRKAVEELLEFIKRSIGSLFLRSPLTGSPVSFYRNS